MVGLFLTLLCVKDLERRKKHNFLKKSAGIYMYCRMPSLSRIMRPAVRRDCTPLACLFVDVDHRGTCRMPGNVVWHLADHLISSNKGNKVQH